MQRKYIVSGIICCPRKLCNRRIVLWSGETTQVFHSPHRFSRSHNGMCRMTRLILSAADHENKNGQNVQCTNFIGLSSFSWYVKPSGNFTATRSQILRPYTSSFPSDFLRNGIRSKPFFEHSVLGSEFVYSNVCSAHATLS